MKYSKYNVVIIGSGISGLFLANKLSENSDFEDGILVITKEQLFSGSSALAQGGIVSVIPELNNKDSIELHIKDTLKAGCGLNNINTIKFVSSNSALVIDDLIRFGVEFDRNEIGKLNFTMEGAHSVPRILHSEGDSTGRIIEQALVDRIKNTKNVEIYDNTMALELLIDSDKSCKGLIAYNWQNNEYEAIYSSNVVIATGGIGQIYAETTNPVVSTGDGIALAYNSGADVADMEFVQFHPTALYCKDKATMPLVSESVRGEGAKLVDIEGHYFARDYDPKADLAPRDVVARAIISQMEKTDSEYVNLDISSIGLEKFKKRFPTITSLCEQNDIDISNCLIPVRPCEHYFMGGIKVDINSKTTIKNLYAIGECASTGLHGANRLASNSLLECAVFASELASMLIKDTMLPPKKNSLKIKQTIEKYANIDVDILADDNEEILLEEFSKLKNIMSHNVGISRTQKGLREAKLRIEKIEKNLLDGDFRQNRTKYELKNAITVSKLIVDAAIERKDSIGAHYRKDCVKQEREEFLNDEILLK